MKKPLVFLLALLLLQGFARAQELSYIVDVVNFRDATGNPYIEVQTDVDGSSLSWQKQANGNFSASVVLQFFIHTSTAANAANALKVELKTPEIRDTSGANKALRISDARRIPLSAGAYTLSGTISDPASPEKNIHEFEREFIVRGADDKLYCFSDILFTDPIVKTEEKSPFSRYGLKVQPRMDGDFFGNEDSLHFYLELYGTDKMVTNGSFYLHTFITPANSEEKAPGSESSLKKAAQPVVLHYASIPVAGLPGQTYYLHFELLSGGKKIAWAARKFFLSNDRVQAVAVTESNPEEYHKYFTLTDEELQDVLGPMQFIATHTEVDFVHSLKTPEEKQAFFLSFWKRRMREGDLSPLKPWMEFKLRVDYANEHYRTNYKKGWMTDRGRTLIRYGPPNDIEPFPLEKWRYPHEIWHYNQIGSQNNLIFVFYDEDLVTGEYSLLHSNVLGERNNPRWQLDLVKRSVQAGNIDQDTPDYKTNSSQPSNPGFYQPR